MVERRGIVAPYPFAVPTPEVYQPRNEERFRAQVAQSTAETLDRLSGLETDIARVAADIGLAPIGSGSFTLDDGNAAAGGVFVMDDGAA